MQIREQGRQVQLIRSPYDSVKKRCVQKVVHTFKKQYIYSSDDITEYLSVQQVEDLSDDEKKTLSVWLATKADKMSADVRRNRIILADTTIEGLADAISSDGVSADQALKIWEAIDKLSKVLKKTGYPKSALKTPAPPVVPAGQANLYS